MLERERAEQHIRRRLFSTTEPLSEVEIAKDLGGSRTSAREAMAGFCARGLLVKNAGAPSQISVSLQDAQDALDLKTVLLKRTIRKSIDNEVKKMGEAEDHLIDAEKAGIAHDVAGHLISIGNAQMRLVELTSGTIPSALMRTLLDGVYCYTSRGTWEPVDFEEHTAIHNDLLSNIKKGNEIDALQAGEEITLFDRSKINTLQKF